jgi:antitoxin component HigA of HigAB toxin-antitoxin module
MRKKRILTTTLVLAGVAVITIPVMAAQTPRSSSRSLRNLANPRILEAHAEALGMSTDELKEELGSGKRMRDILEDNGVKPSELRDSIHERFPELPPPEAMQRARHFRARGMHMNPDVMAAKADLLGLTVEELTQALDSGRKMHELLSERDMTPQELHEAMDYKYPDLKLGNFMGQGKGRHKVDR